MDILLCMSTTSAAKSAAAPAAGKNGQKKTTPVKGQKKTEPVKRERVYICAKDMRISLKGAENLPFAVGYELRGVTLGSEVPTSARSRHRACRSSVFLPSSSFFRCLCLKTCPVRSRNVDVSDGVEYYTGCNLKLNFCSCSPVNQKLP